MKTESFDILNPPLPKNGVVKYQDSEVKARDDKSKLAHYEPARKIIRQRQSKNRTKYLVLFRDGTTSWCNDISPALYEHFLLKQETDRSRKRRRKRQ